MKDKPAVPLGRWLFWGVEYVGGIILFYVELTPIWSSPLSSTMNSGDGFHAPFRARRRRY